MIVYHKTKMEFLKDVESGLIADIIDEALESILLRKTGKSEYNSWENSLQRMYHVLNDASIPNDSGIAVEYNIPRTSNRIDMLISGYDKDENGSLIVVELKQWEKIKVLQMDGMIGTWFQHGYSEHVHPSYQAWSYASFLEGYNTYIYSNKVGIYPCVYMHNYKLDGNINNSVYDEYIKKAPLYGKGQGEDLKNFIKKNIKTGDKKNVLNKIENSELKPSKILAETLDALLKGNKEFILIDDQKIVYEKALKLIKESTKTKKKVLIVHGGPGTGKSVVAINLLVKMISEPQMAQYVTKNAAPRAVFSESLLGKYKKNYVGGLFKGSGGYHELKSNLYKTLIVDEAHRLNEFSGLFGNLGENQVKELINTAHCTIFFLDENQKVTLKDIGTEEEIKKWAEFYNADVEVLELKSQFRCGGSNAYLLWLDNTLQLRETANSILYKNEYEFKIFDNPNALFKAIYEKNKEKNSARLVAGYCWNWISKKNPELMDIEFPQFKFSKQWNLSADGGLYINSPNSVHQIGCIHTCQGLEVEYIGVIIGSDMVVRNGEIIIDPTKRAKTDMSIRGWKNIIKGDKVGGMDTLNAIVKNTYRTLMTRGMKGCYIYCVDKETEEWIRSRLETSN